MELRLTTVVVAFAFIGLVSCVPTRHSKQQSTQHNQRISGSSSEADILRLLKSIDEQVKDDISTQTPAQFTELVQRLSQLEHNVISSIDRQVRSSSSAFSSRKIEDLWNDALIMDASEGSLRLITRQILDSTVSASRKSYLLTMMAFIQSPSTGAVRAVLPLLEDKQVERQTILSVSALIANARKNNSLPEKELREAVNAIIEYLKQHESSADKVTVALKALHNLHSLNDDVALVAKYAADTKKAKSVRLAALEALADHAADDFVVKKVQKIYYDATETAEIRIAAYKVLVSHANSQVISQIVASLNSEANKQVGAFVASHLANLKETDAPRHQQVRHLLANVAIPTDRFPSDLRKYSRNVELSQSSLGLGAVVDADLIYEQSLAPRSVRFNLSLPMYHREINLIEVSLRQEGLENEMEKLLSANGPFAGKNMKQIVNDITEFFASSEMANRVQYRKSLARSASSGDLDVSMALKLDGNTVAYFDIADLTNSQNDMRVVINQLKQQMSGDWSQDRAFAFKFDRSFNIPSGSGYKTVDVNGTAVFGFKVDRSGLWPSMAMELSTRTPEKHIIARVNSSPSLKFVIEGSKITLRFADNQMNILTISNEAYDIDSEGRETAIVVPSRSFQHCFNGMNKALGMQVCAKLSAPKNLWSQKAPCFAQWTMTLSLLKSDSKMNGWQFGWESSNNQRNHRVTFDTPRSSIKRNVAVEIELLEQLTGLRGKIELPRRSMEMSAGYKYTEQHLLGKLQLNVNENEKYSLEAGLKSKPSGKRSEWEPLLRIETPKSQPIVLTGTISRESGRKNSMAFDLHNNVQGEQRKSIKGSITREGSFLKNLKLSANLQAQVDSVSMRLFSTAEKKQDGSAHTDVKVEYQLPNARAHKAEFIGKIQNLDASGESLKMNSFVELKMTQFPEKNVHLSWNIQHKPQEHLENELTIMWKDQMNDPKRKIHLLHSVKLTGVKSAGITATCDNFASIDIAPLNIKYEVKAFGHYQRSGPPNYKLSFEVNNKVTKNNVAASWEYRHKSVSPLKVSLDASLRINDRAYRYSDKIEEIAPRSYKGATELQWANEKKANINYIFKRQSEGNDEIYRLDGDLRLPSYKPIEHSGMMRIGAKNVQFNHKMTVSQDNSKLWDISGRMTKDDKSNVQFSVSGVEGKMEIVPFGARKTAHLSFNGASIQHVSDITLSPESLNVASKTSDGKKTLFAVNSKMNEQIVAGPHDWEVRYAGPSTKAGERKIKIHHAINNGKGESTVAYYVKNQEQAKFEIYAQNKATVDSKVELIAGMTLKTAAKYQKYDGFKVELSHQHGKETGAVKGYRTASTLNAELTEEEKVRLTVETNTAGNLRDGRAYAKVIVDTPVFDFKHQEAAFSAEWNPSRARVSMNGVTNEKKNIRADGEFRKTDDRIYAELSGESEVHGQKHEATFSADKQSVTLTAKSNGKVILHTDGKVKYNTPRDFTASLAGKLMSSPSYHGAIEARSTGKQVAYNVQAKKDDKVYATGDMTVDTTSGCNVALKMKLSRRNISFSLDSQAARDLVHGPHKFTATVEGDRLSRRSVKITHSMADNKLRQSVIYTVNSEEAVKLDSNIFYLAQKEGRSTKYTSNMDIVMQVQRDTYKMNHEGFVKIHRDSFEFTSKAQLQGKDIWSFDGQLGKSGKQTFNFIVADHSGKMECSPYADIKVARIEIQSKRYHHQTAMEVNSRKLYLKLNSKATVQQKPLYTLDISRVPEQANALTFESKWFDVKINGDMTRSPVTASFVYSGKTKDKTEMKGNLSVDKNTIDISAEGKCAYSKKYSSQMKVRRSATQGEMELTIEENNRDRFSSRGRYETNQGFRGVISCKSNGKEIIALRALLEERVSNGPNEVEIIFDSNESIKLRHEAAGKRHTVTLEHFKAGARKNFATASGEIEMTQSKAAADLTLEGDFEKRIGAVKTMKVHLSHVHENVRRSYTGKSLVKATINNALFNNEMRWSIDPRARVTVEMESQSPIHKFERQSLIFESKWDKQSASIQSRLMASAGCALRLEGKWNVDAKRASSVSGSVAVETAKKNFERQEGSFSADWDESKAQFTLKATDAKSRKLELAGQSEISAEKIFARGQCDSTFPSIKSSFVEVRGDKESADVLVKYNNKEILKGEAKGQWKNTHDFHATVEGRARQSPLYTLEMHANKIASEHKYTLEAKRDAQSVAEIEVTGDVSDAHKYTVEARLPTIKTKGSMKGEFSRVATHGPHHLTVDFENERYGTHSASLTHKIQDGKVKCVLQYSRDGKAQLDIQHSGTYNYQVNGSQRKLSMDADFDCKVEKRSYSIHHAGAMEMTRDAFTIESKATYNRKGIWDASCKLSKKEQSSVTIGSGKRSAHMKVSPFGNEKALDIEYRSPMYTHDTHGRMNVQTWEGSFDCKSQKQTSKLVDLSIVRRTNGASRMTLESQWADASAECDASKEPMTAHVSLKSKKMSPSVDMKIKGSLGNEKLELDGDFKSSNAYSGSLRASRKSDKMIIEVDSKKNEKPFYNGRVNAAIHADAIKGDARLTRKDINLARVTVSLNKQLVNGPHQVDVTLPGKQEDKLSLRHEILAGQWKASATHMAKGEKKAFAEVTGKASGKWSAADVAFTFNGEKKGKKIMHLSSLSVTFAHKHLVNKNGLELSSSMKSFINRKDNLIGKVECQVDVRSRASLTASLQTPFNDYKNQELTFESNWEREAIRVQGKFVNASGKSVEIKGNSSVQSGRWVMNGNVESHIESIPSIQLNGSANSKGFAFTVDKNAERTFEVSGDVKSIQWNNVDATFEGNYKRGPTYSASVSGKTRSDGGEYEFVARKNKRDLMGAHATTKINSPSDWQSAFAFDNQGERMASFDLMKGQCADGHPSYIAAYSVKDMEPRKSFIHEADVEPLFRTIRSIRGI